jgi:hypothetical protein
MCKQTNKYKFVVTQFFVLQRQMEHDAPRVGAGAGSAESADATAATATMMQIDGVDAKGCTPLHWAIWRCHQQHQLHQHQEPLQPQEDGLQTIRQLLSRGANPNAAIGGVVSASHQAKGDDAMDEEEEEGTPNLDLIKFPEYSF